MKIDVTDMHTAGEPVRIVTGGYPELMGSTIIDKKNYASRHYDALRRALMLEPRGHAEMFGMIPVKPTTDGAAIGALYIHTTGYSTMSGHGLIAFCRWALETGQVPLKEPVTTFGVELPCGVIEVTCHISNGKVISTSFDSVPAFLSHRDQSVLVPSLGDVKIDIAYGGAYYAILSASSINLSFEHTPVEELVRVTTEINDSARRSVAINHPDEPDFGYLFGTILTDDATAQQDSFHLCIFAGRQIDRSPTGGGVIARMARDHARGLIATGETRAFYGPTPIPFEAEILRQDIWHGQPTVTVRVSGSASFVGQSSFIIDPSDSLTYGFNLPDTYAGLRSDMERQPPSAAQA